MNSENPKGSGAPSGAGGPGDTPIMKQYAAMKARYPKHLLFFCVGDFYELFYEDAKTISRVLGLTLTCRNKGADPIPMAGVPVHAAEPYLARLLRQGYSVALCDQMELASQTKGLVRREITRVVTPGTVLEENLLDARKANRIVALLPQSFANEAEKTRRGARGEKNHRTEECEIFGLAVADLSTGTFFVQELRGVSALRSELARLTPTEMVLAENSEPGAGDAKAFLARLSMDGTAVTRSKPGAFDPAASLARLLARFAGGGRDQTAAAELKNLSRSVPLAFCAAGALAGYIEETYPGGKFRLLPPLTFDPERFVALSESAIRSLELTETLRGRALEGSLLWSIDRCCTPPGSRCLREWLIRPLRSKSEIIARQDAVAALLEQAQAREDLRAVCKRLADLERIAARLCAGKATPRDLIALKDSLLLLPRIDAAAGHARAGGANLLEDPAPYGEGQITPAPLDGTLLNEIRNRIRDLGDIAATIAARLRDECPNVLNEGGLIRDSVDAELDRLREIVQGGKGWIAQFQASECERTGIGSLKVGFNRVFGYFIEISRANKALVPPEYERRQTLAGAERFTTPDLKLRESEVLSAEEKINALEQRLFLALRDEIAADAPRLYSAGEALAQLDALASLAEVAHRRNHVRPAIVDVPVLKLEQMRHPVLEETLPSGELVPNDVKLGGGEGGGGLPQLVILTGPNMAGKSTYIRCTALCTILAQMGAFVPAERAEVGLVDRIFTRVGAADDLASGRSTFMVEMSEVAEILAGCSGNSLVILDEVGRGTSTYDGVSLAWALIEHLHEGRCKPRTLFATHYHELSALAGSLPRVRNASAAVKEWQGEITFLHRIVEGSSERSFGIHVARLAGLPESVITRARAILLALEDDSTRNIPETQAESAPGVRPIESAPSLQLWSEESRAKRAKERETLDLFELSPEGIARKELRPEPTDKASAKLIADLARIEVETLTPLQALTKLDKLVREARKRRS